MEIYNCVIAEDDVLLNEIFVEWARQLKLNVVASVESGTALIDAVRQNDVQIIITDIGLHRMNGLDACQKIIDDGYDPQIIVISGSMTKERFNDFDLGKVNYLQKPTMYECFSGAVMEAIRRYEDS